MIVRNNRALLLALSLGASCSIVQSQSLTQAEIEYVQTFVNKAHETVEVFVKLIFDFIDPADRQPLSTYTLHLQQQLQRFKRLTTDLKTKIKNQPDSQYKTMLKDAKQLVEKINVGLVIPIYKCLVGKRTKAKISLEDRAEMLAAALKISIDEFNATSSKEIIQQFKILHTYLNNLGLHSIAETIKNVVDLLADAQNTQQEGLDEAGKKVIKAAILLKLQLDNR